MTSRRRGERQEYDRRGQAVWSSGAYTAVCEGHPVNGPSANVRVVAIRFPTYLDFVGSHAHRGTSPGKEGEDGWREARSRGSGTGVRTTASTRPRGTPRSTRGRRSRRPTVVARTSAVGAASRRPQAPASLSAWVAQGAVLRRAHAPRALLRRTRTECHRQSHSAEVPGHALPFLL